MGRVHAVSCMVGAPAWHSGLASVRAMRDHGADIGLHLDLTEHPMVLAPWRRLQDLLVASFSRKLDSTSVLREIKSQLDRFEVDMACAPTFVDGHQHIHQLPHVREPLLEELKRRYGTHGPWLRSARPPAGMLWRPGMAGVALKSAVIDVLGRRGLGRLAQRQGLAQNSHLLGAYDFEGGPARYQALLMQWLALAQDGDLLMCHPGCARIEGDALSESRIAEFDVLSGPEFERWVQQARLHLEPMSRIIARRRA
jgi:predicted glycoside hydrolase/deacetylase ChbG (UPF0249 family)